MPNKLTPIRGFTLVELLVTISIAAILLALAIPSFTETIANNRLSSNANELVTALNFARSEAVKRGLQVTILHKGSTNQQWEEGWDIFVDNDGNGALNDDGDTSLCETGEDCLLRTYEPLPEGYTLRSGGNYACWVAYLPDGLSRGSGSTCAGGNLPTNTFRLCDSYASTTRARSIVTNNVGRVKIDMGTASCP